MKRVLVLLGRKIFQKSNAIALVLAILACVTIPLPVTTARYIATSTAAVPPVRIAAFDVVSSSYNYVGEGEWSDAPNIVQLATAGPASAVFELPLFDHMYSTNRDRAGTPTVIGTNFVEHLFRPRAPFGFGNAEPHIFENAPAGYYAFLLRGGDGGTSRMPAGNVGGYGGAGGMVMGYFRLDTPQTLYIEVGSAGRGGLTAAYDYRAHFGGGNNFVRGGQGGGATIISTSSLRGGGNSANIIAVAGGGGGAGGSNGALSHPHNNGGNAGGAGNVAGNSDHLNPILNGAVAQTGAVAVAGGFASGGVQGGNPVNRLKIINPVGTGQSNSAGGGGATEGGRGGFRGGATLPPAGRHGTHLLGGNACSSTAAVDQGSGGGGAGWFGGGAGGHDGPWHGGGGGGSSFVRSNVNPMPPEIAGSRYFADLIALQNYALASNAVPGSAVRYIAGAPPRIVERENARSVALQDPHVIEDYANAGWNGFAYLVYIGPVHPSEQDSRALVVAPGTGMYGALINNPNDVSADGADSRIAVSIANRSDVTIRFKLELDFNNSVIPTVQGVRLPMVIRLYGGATGVSGGFTRLDQAVMRPDGMRNMFMRDDDPNAIVGGFAGWPITVEGQNAWFTLQPGQQTGVGGVPALQFLWAWLYDFQSLGNPGHGFAAPPGNHWSWANPNWFGTPAANRVHWLGIPNPLNDPALLPHLLNTNVDNINRFDTLLGREAARRRQNGLPPLELSLVFRVTIEQVD